MNYLLYELALARTADLHEEAERGRRAALVRQHPRRAARVRHALRPAFAAFAALVVISALLVPAASAQPIDPPSVGVAKATPAQTHTAVPLVAESASSDASAASSGFDWGDAAVGAAGMLLMLSAGAAGVVIVRRSRERGQTLVAG
jgi:hypothetical protein